MRLIAIAALILAGFFIAVEHNTASAGVEAVTEVPAWATRACKYEDSVNCHWDAKNSGNGKGNSFFVRLMPHAKHAKKVMVCWIFIDRPRLDYCERMDRGAYSR